MAKKKTNKPLSSPKGVPSAIVVLGMHRSGTSALSGLLSKFGCDTPQTVMPAQPDNVKGFFESKPFSDVLDSVLKSAGSSWQDWRPFNSEWMQSIVAPPFIDEAAEVLRSEFLKSKLFVLKNPRLCRLMPFLQQVLDTADAAPFYVLEHRNPIEVGSSLLARNKINPASGQMLWLRHVLDAEFGTRGHPRYFTSYDRVIADWAAETTLLQKVLGIKFPKSVNDIREDVRAFLSPDLRHHQVPSDIPLGDPNVSAWVRSVYNILESWAGGPGDERDFETLDNVRLQFNAMAANVGTLVQDGVELPAKQEKAATEAKARDEKHAALLASLETEKTALQAKITAAAGELTTAYNMLSVTQSSLEQRSLEAEQTHVELGALRNELAQTVLDAVAKIKSIEEDRDDRLKQLTTENHELKSEMRVRFGELAELSHLLLSMQARHEQAAKHHTETLLAAEKRHAEQTALLNEKLGQIEALKARVETANTSLEAVNTSFQMIKSSTSWRITAPLRSVIDKMRRMRRRR